MLPTLPISDSATFISGGEKLIVAQITDICSLGGAQSSTMVAFKEGGLLSVTWKVV